MTLVCSKWRHQVGGFLLQQICGKVNLRYLLTGIVIMILITEVLIKCS